MAVARRWPTNGGGQRTIERNRTWAAPPANTSPANPIACAAGSLKRPKTITARIAWVPSAAPRLPIATSNPAPSDSSASAIRWTHSTSPVMQPTNVANPISTESANITASGGRPPVVRHAIPTSIAPTPIVTPATGSPAAIGMPSIATTGTAPSRPAVHDTDARSNRAAARTALLNVDP